MKKITAVVFAIVLFMPFLAMAEGVLGVTASSTLPSGQYIYKAPVVADSQAKAGAGFLHCIIVSQNDAAPTAGSIIIYDSLTETGTQIFNWTLTTAVFVPFAFCPDVVFNTGLYIGFTTTGDVNVQVSYR